MPRPSRKRCPDFAGRLISLPEEPENWQQLTAGADGIVLLGLGPGDPQNLPFIKAAGGQKIFWLESPQGAADAPLAPADWVALAPGQAASAMAGRSVYFYRPGLRLAPDFWAPLLARAAIGSAPAATRPGLVWLPGNDRQLLHAELRAGLRELGYGSIAERSLPPDEWLASFGSHKPELALSVNFRGLDPEGRIFGFCRELDIPLAIWLVDNPWNLLTGIPLPWWRQARLFVTDASFIADLKRYGAKNARYLPLAAAQHMFGARPQREVAEPAFIGRSAFPGRERFFAAVKQEAGLLAQAEAEMRAGKLPDFHWWQNRLDLPLWPGSQVRQISQGADICSGSRRAHWAAQGLAAGLSIIGDAGWRELLPGARILPPVDYYAQLPEIYARHACILNVTSLLLPGSLNQRHFDVWAAGGFLLTDGTAGLALFPDELTDKVTLAAPGEFGERLAFFQQRPALKAELGHAWRECLLAGHTYRHRLCALAAELGIRLPG
ncbi:MAG: glycosyltransferase [Desulfovibrio sp.]|nr:glycosyltransferase [Desulfovibrio sp.]